MAHPPDGGLVEFHDHGSAPFAADDLQRPEPQLSARGTLHGAFSFFLKGTYFQALSTHFPHSSPFVQWLSVFFVRQRHVTTSRAVSVQRFAAKISAVFRFFFGFVPR